MWEYIIKKSLGFYMKENERERATLQYVKGEKITTIKKKVA